MAANRGLSRKLTNVSATDMLARVEQRIAIEEATHADRQVEVRGATGANRDQAQARLDESDRVLDDLRSWRDELKQAADRERAKP